MSHRTLLLLIGSSAVLTGIFGLTARAADAKRAIVPCPVDTAATRIAPDLFLTSSEYAGEREALGLADSDSSSLRALRSPADSAVCAALDSAGRVALPSPSLTGYFTAGNHYFIVGRRSGVISGFVTLVVLDSTFTVRKIAAM